jgi:DNA-binding CsgD family transcriptional regulator
MQGEAASGLAELEAVLGWLPEEPSVARASVLASLAHGRLRLGDASTRETAQAALDVARRIGARAQESDALITLGASLGYQEDFAGGAVAQREGLAIALEISDHDQALRGYANLSDTLQAEGRYRDAADSARAGLELAGRVGQLRTFGVFLVGNLVEPLVRLGEWDEAERLARENLLTEPIGVFAATLLEMLGYLTACQGRSEEALECVRRARRHLGDSSEPQFTHSLAYVEADALRARGDLDAATAAVMANLAETPAAFWLPRYLSPLLWLGARIDADRATRARDRGQPAPEPLMSGVPSGNLAFTAPALHAYRLMSAAEGERRDGRGAVDAWSDAVRAWEEAGDAWPQAYARFRLAEVLCGEGRRDEAAGPLRASWAAARAMGALPLHDEVVALARRARVALEDVAPAAGDVSAEAAVPFGLTDREREVLALVAAGRSNGQIATALFISPKTASVHVSNILAKLGVSGRVEAAGVAHRLGLVDRAS